MIGVAALALRLLVPAGYMISSEHGQIGMALCSNTAGQPSVTAMSAMHGNTPDHGRSRDHGKGEMPCAFSSLSAQALGSIDPILMVAAIAFIMVTGRRRVRRLTVPLRLNLWPPLRGPPVSF